MVSKASKVIIIDGNSFFYKFFFAIESNPFSLDQFLQILEYSIQKIATKDHYSGCLVVFDSTKDTFRKKIFSEYKANRGPMPENLVKSLPHIKQKFLDCGFNVQYAPENYEGDDLIASYAHNFDQRGISYDVFTTDKDLLQLVSYWGTVNLLKTGVSDIERYELNNFSHKTQGLKPYQIPFFKALSGDRSDNYLGVENIGEVKARGLILKYKNLNNLLMNLSDLGSKTQEILLQHEERLKMFMKLACLVKNLTIQHFI